MTQAYPQQQKVSEPPVAESEVVVAPLPETAPEVVAKEPETAPQPTSEAVKPDEAPKTEETPKGDGDQEPVVKEQDKRSVFIENVDYGATKEELESLFCECGKIVRVTILRDKYTNTPRGLAYVEFADVESVDHAIVLTGAELRGRFIRVSPKRTNIKGMAKQKKKKYVANDNTSAFIQNLLGMMGKPGRFNGGPPKPKT